MWVWVGVYIRLGLCAHCSKSGAISQFAYEYLQENVKDVLPALGTHAPMTDDEITKVANATRLALICSSIC